MAKQTQSRQSSPAKSPVVPTAQPVPEVSTPTALPEPVAEITPATASVPFPAVTVPDQSAGASPVQTFNRAPIPKFDQELLDRLKSLTPDQRASLRVGAALTATRTGKNVDGSLDVLIHIDADTVPQLETWAEEAGKPVTEQAQELIGSLLASYLNSPMAPLQPMVATADGLVPWQEPGPETEPVTELPPAVPPAVPPAAAAVPPAAK